VIAFTSCRPMGRSPEYDRNQLAAKASWERQLDSIVYLNDYEPLLASDKTLFIPHDPFPRIHDIASNCAAQPDWSCIINADIVLGDNFRRVESILKRKGASAAMSRRYEFEPGSNLSTARVPDHDFGLDFFAAIPSVWQKVAEICPTELRHGCQRWDGWLIAFLNAVACNGFYSVTSHRCIFHPRHGDRQYGHEIPSVPLVGPIYFPPELV